MNYLKQAVLALCLLPTVGLLSSCEQKPAATVAPATELPATTGSEATPVAPAAYICPMNCEGSASSQPGKCPVCKMDLQPNPAAQPATTL